MGVAVGVLGMPVGVLTMLVSCGRVLLGLLVLAVSMVMGGLKVVVRGGVVTGRGLVMMLNRRVFVLFGHGSVLLQSKVEGWKRTVTSRAFAAPGQAGLLTRQVRSGYP
jgi:hypothetical protein